MTQKIKLSVSIFHQHDSGLESICSNRFTLEI